MSRLILIIFCLILIFLIGLFLIWPKYQRFNTFKLEIEAKEMELQYTEEHFSKLKQLAQELKKYENQLAKIDLALPPDSFLTIISLVDFIQKSSAQNGLVFKKLGYFSIVLPEPSTPTPDSPQVQPVSGIKEISLDFEVSGSYSALKNFLGTLEKSAKIIEVKNISFSVEKEEISPFSLKIKTYSY